MMRTTKKIRVIFFLISSFLFGQLVFAASVGSASNIGISSAVISARTGKLIAGQNQNITLPIASLTKLMTALVLLDLGINFNKKVVITKPQVDYTLPYVSQGDVTSKIDLLAGDKVIARDLWKAMLIASSNEAAIALVDQTGLSRANFVKRMNRKAKALGLKKTKFTEPSGIDPNNISTAGEMAVIARRAYAVPSIRQASILAEYRFKELNTGRKVAIISRNSSLLAMKPLGMKIGYLAEAKDNCALRLKKSGKDRIVVVLHAANTSRRNMEINRLMSK